MYWKRESFLVLQGNRTADRLARSLVSAQKFYPAVDFVRVAFQTQYFRNRLTHQVPQFVLIKSLQIPQCAQNIHQKSGEKKSYYPAVFVVWAANRPRAVGGRSNLCNCDREGGVPLSLWPLLKYVTASVSHYRVHSLRNVTPRSVCCAYVLSSAAGLHAVSCEARHAGRQQYVCLN